MTVTIIFYIKGNKQALVVVLKTAKRKYLQNLLGYLIYLTMKEFTHYCII